MFISGGGDAVREPAFLIDPCKLLCNVVAVGFGFLLWSGIAPAEGQRWETRVRTSVSWMMEVFPPRSKPALAFLRRAGSAAEHAGDRGAP